MANEEIVTRFRVEESGAVTSLQRLTQQQDVLSGSTAKVAAQSEAMALSHGQIARVMNQTLGPEVANMTRAFAGMDKAMATIAPAVAVMGAAFAGWQLGKRIDEALGISAALNDVKFSTEELKSPIQAHAQVLAHMAAEANAAAAAVQHLADVQKFQLSQTNAFLAQQGGIDVGGTFKAFTGQDFALPGDAAARSIGGQVASISQALDTLTGKFRQDFTAGLAQSILDGGIDSMTKLGDLVPQLVPLVDRDALANIVNDPAVQQAMSAIKAKRATDEAEAYIAGAEEAAPQVGTILAGAVAPVFESAVAAMSEQLAGFRATIGQIRGGDLASAPEEVQALFASLSQQGSRTHTGGSAARISPQRLAFLQNLYAGTNEDEISDFIGTLQEQRSALLSGRTGSARNATFVRESLDLQIQGLQNLQLLIEELVRQGKIQTRPEPTDLSDATINKLVTGLRTTR